MEKANSRSLFKKCESEWKIAFFISHLSWFDVDLILDSFCTSSIDGTCKYQFRTKDGFTIEACVVFFSEKPAPVNICISSQVGCECSCLFCVTGNKRFVRNLTSEEIEEQVALIFKHDQNLLQHKFEITYMGTGEPLRNKDNVFQSAKRFSQKYDLLYRINISSIFPDVDISLQKICSIKTLVHFQYSLHFVTDNLRTQYFRRKLAPIQSVFEVLNELYAINKSPYCVNYVLFDSINDRPQDAEILSKMMQPLPAYLKISKYCPIKDSMLKESTHSKQFCQILDDAKIVWKSFESKGADIHAACGHLLSDIQF